MSLGKRLISTDAAGASSASSFNTVIYDGDGGTKAITGVGFEPSFVWLKARDNGTNNHLWTDSIRGVGVTSSVIGSNLRSVTNFNFGHISAFGSDGFTVAQGSSSGNYVNSSIAKYVAYCWYAPTSESIGASGSRIASTVKKNVAAGFSIVKYEGTGVSATVGHGLTQPPELIIAKNLDTAGGSGTYDGWPVYASAIGNDHLLNLSSTAPKASTGGTWDSTTPTSTVFSVKDNVDNNKSGDNIIAYCFHSVAGSQMVGSYTGDGQANRSVTTGFSPKFLLLKSTVGNDNWRLYDTVRGISAGFLEPNNGDSENTYLAPNITMTPTGFEITSGGVSAGNNTASNLYIFLAIA